MSTERLLAPLASLAISILLVASAQLVIKARLANLGPMPASSEIVGYLGKVIMDPLLWLAGFLLLAAAGLWYFGLSRVPLTTAVYFAALIYPIITIASYLYLGESLSFLKLLGMALIAGGVVLTIAAG